MKKIITIFLLCFAYTMNAHPLHMSVTNITLSNSIIEISITAFAKDLTHELNAFNHKDNDMLFYLNDLGGDSILIKHIHNNVSLHINDELVLFSSFAVELLDENFVFKAIINKPYTCSSLTVTNNLLLKTFHDQKNLVIVNCNGTEAGLELNVDKPSDRLVF